MLLHNFSPLTLQIGLPPTAEFKNANNFKKKRLHLLTFASRAPFFMQWLTFKPLCALETSPPQSRTGSVSIQTCLIMQIIWHKQQFKVANEESTTINE